MGLFKGDLPQWGILDLGTAPKRVRLLLKRIPDFFFSKWVLSPLPGWEKGKVE